MKKMSLLNCVPYVFTCQRALCAYVPTCQGALRAYMLTCQRALCAYVLTCLVCLLPTCLACFACSCANAPCMLCVPMCPHTITTNNKNKFSITCFPYIFVIVLCLFPVK